MQETQITEKMTIRMINLNLVKKMDTLAKKEESQSMTLISIETSTGSLNSSHRVQRKTKINLLSKSTTNIKLVIHKIQIKKG